MITILKSQNILNPVAIIEVKIQIYLNESHSLLDKDDDDKELTIFASK